MTVKGLCRHSVIALYMSSPSSLAHLQGFDIKDFSVSDAGNCLYAFLLGGNHRNKLSKHLEVRCRGHRYVGSDDVGIIACWWKLYGLCKMGGISTRSVKPTRKCQDASYDDFNAARI